MYFFGGFPHINLGQEAPDFVGPQGEQTSRFHTLPLAPTSRCPPAPPSPPAPPAPQVVARCCQGQESDIPRLQCLQLSISPGRRLQAVQAATCWCDIYIRPRHSSHPSHPPLPHAPPIPLPLPSLRLLPPSLQALPAPTEMVGGWGMGGCGLLGYSRPEQCRVQCRVPTTPTLHLPGAQAWQAR